MASPPSEQQPNMAVHDSDSSITHGTNPWSGEGAGSATADSHSTPVAMAHAASTAPMSTATATETAHEEPDDPRIGPLVAMFPGIDHSVLSSVLDSVNGDQDRAIDILLGMSDPNFIQEVRPGAVTAGETDEEMARRLAAEEEMEAAWYPQQQDPSRTQQPQQRAGRGRGGAGNITRGQPGSSTGENDTFAQVQDQVLKFADAGKKTFLSFASKVKQKIQEFDNPNNPREHHRDWHDPTYPADETLDSAHTQPQYYDHTVNVPYRPPPGQTYTPTPPATQVQGFDVEAPGAAKRSDPVSIPKTGPVATGAGTSSSPAPPASFDASRIGLLPKRPVSLIDNTTASKRTTVEDDDDLEYVENPFEEKAQK